MRKIAPLFVAIYILLFAQHASAYVGLCCGKCGGNMPMNILGAGVPETHEFRFKITPMFMNMDGLRDGTSSVNSDSILMPAMNMGGMGMGSGGTKYMAVPTSMDMTMLNMAAGYSFTDDFFGGIMFMWQKNSMPMKFSPMMRQMLGTDGFSMESSGMADTMLMTKYRLYTDDPMIPTEQASLFMGLSLPTGSINEKNETHPAPARQSGQLPYPMQLGSGTFDPMIGLVYQASTSPWWWGVNAIYTGRFYKNSRDYSLGDEFRLDTYAMYQMRYDLVAQIQLNGRVWGKIDGEMDEAISGASGRIVKGDPTSGYTTPRWDPDHYGGQSLMTTLGLQWQPIPLHIIDLSVGLPLYQDLNGIQLEKSYSVALTWYIEVPTPSSIRYTGKRKSTKSKLGF